MKAKHVQESSSSDKDQKKEDKKCKSQPKKKKTKYVVVDSDMLLSSDSSSVISMEPEMMCAKVKNRRNLLHQMTLNKNICMGNVQMMNLTV